MDTPIPHIRERESGFDVLRLFAMIAVVATHVMMVYRVPDAPVSAVTLVDALLHFAVPVFFFVSGALVWGRYTGRTGTEYASFLRRRSATVAAPYLAWSALYLTIAGLRGDWVYWVTHTPLLVLTGRSWYHLYFVPVLLLFYLLTPIAAPLMRRWPELTVAVAFIVRLTLLPSATEFADRVGGPMLVTFTAVAVTHLSHMALGAWFARRSRQILPFLRSWWAVLLIPGMLLVAGDALGATTRIDAVAGMAVPAGMALVVLGLAGIAFKLRLTQPQAAFTARAAAYSFGVYLLHPAIVLAWRTAVTSADGSAWWNSFWFALLSATVITVASVAASALLARNRSTAWLIGHHATSRTRKPAPVRVTPLAPSET